MLPFAPLERLPLFLRSQVEEMGVAATHLGDEILGDGVGRELTGFLAENELPGEVQHHVGYLVANRGGVAAGQCGIELVDLLDEVGAERFAGLNPVPAATGAKIGHHCDRPAQRGFVLHHVLRGPSLRHA